MYSACEPSKLSETSTARCEAKQAEKEENENEEGTVVGDANLLFVQPKSRSKTVLDNIDVNHLK